MRIQERMHEEYLKATERQEELERLLKTHREVVERAAQPVISVEGRLDKLILEEAWDRLRPSDECPFQVRPVDPSGEEGGADILAKAIETVDTSDGRTQVAVFDRDTQGIKAFGRLSKNFVRTVNQDVAHHKNGVAVAMLLPIPSFRQEKAKNEGLCIEFLFPDEALDVRTADGRGLELEVPQPIVMVNNRRIKYDPNQISLDLSALITIKSGKSVFAREIVPVLPDSMFDAFEPLVSTLVRLSAQPSRAGPLRTRH